MSCRRWKIEPAVRARLQVEGFLKARGALSESDGSALRIIARECLFSGRSNGDGMSVVCPSAIIDGAILLPNGCRRVLLPFAQT